MARPFNPAAWYWRADDGRIFSSAAMAEVAADNAGLLAWSAAGGVPTIWPRDDAGDQTEASIRATLIPFDVPVRRIVSDRQFYQALAQNSLITEAEALAAVCTGEIPAALQALVDAMPEGERFGAKMLLSGAVEFHRDNPLVAQFTAANAMTAAQVDAIWSLAASL